MSRGEVIQLALTLKRSSSFIKKFIEKSFPRRVIPGNAVLSFPKLRVLFFFGLPTRFQQAILPEFVQAQIDEFQAYTRGEFTRPLNVGCVASVPLAELWPGARLNPFEGVDDRRPVTVKRTTDGQTNFYKFTRSS